MMTPKKGQRLIPEPQRKKNYLAVRLTDEELKQLNRIASRRNLPTSYFVREGVDDSCLMPENEFLNEQSVVRADR
jgi:predicted DNA-binding protein